MVRSGVGGLGLTCMSSRSVNCLQLFVFRGSRFFCENSGASSFSCAGGLGLRFCVACKPEFCTKRSTYGVESFEQATLASGCFCRRRL